MQHLAAKEEKSRQIDAKKKHLLELEADLAAHSQRYETQLKLTESLTVALEAMEQASAMRSLVERLSDERAKLVDGSPCPLCGAVHHPYAETQPAILSDDSHKLERTRKDLKAAQTTVASLAREVAKLDGTIKAERGTLNELQTLFLLEPRPSAN